MLTVLAFVVGLGLLIGIHEYGHYRMALACGVKVLRFSIGFGKPLLRWSAGQGRTEFVLAAIPLGGYVRMLDEREAPVAAHERHLAFNTQPLRSRALIVAAGPVANFLLAIALYAGVNWMGVLEPKAILATPVPGSVADVAGLRGGELVVAVAVDGDEPETVDSFDHLRWRLLQAALQGHDAVLTTAPRDAEFVHRDIRLALGELQARNADDQLLKKIGLNGPWTTPTLGEVLPDGAALAAGLQVGDLVLSVNRQPVVDGQGLRQLIRQAVGPQGQPQTQQWTVSRQGRTLTLAVTPKPERQNGTWVGRVGAYIGQPPDMVLVRKGPIDGLTAAAQKTWDVSLLSLQMMGKMIVGEASLKNLSGPLTMADYAGRSASIGVTAYILFLALISVSLGVLNLLPLPVLDGGHLMYYLWEGVTGRPVSEVWQDRLQRGGVVILLGMMSIALFNDVARLVG
ncbi:MAG: RIP metalloprotease RseP [Polaromonas sp.]|nr:RIP metalloprotease RseP [Polaromonas sp.]